MSPSILEPVVFFFSLPFSTSKTFIFNFAPEAGSSHGFSFLRVPGLEVTNSKVIKITLMPRALKASGPPLPAVGSEITSPISFTPAASPLSGMQTLQELHLLCCSAIVLTALKDCAAVTEVVQYSSNHSGVQMKEVALQNNVWADMQWVGMLGNLEFQMKN